MLSEINKKTKLVLGTIILTTIIVLGGLTYTYFSTNNISSHDDSIAINDLISEAANKPYNSSCQNGTTGYGIAGCSVYQKKI